MIQQSSDENVKKASSGRAATALQKRKEFDLALEKRNASTTANEIRSNQIMMVHMSRNITLLGSPDKTP
jgi:hypothetical protein